MKRSTSIAVVVAMGASALAGAAEPDGSLFENVVKVLQARYYDEEFRETVLPGIVDRYRERARAVSDPAGQRQVTHEFLSNIPASHLALLSAASHTRMMDELMNRDAPTFGFTFIEYDGKHYAHDVLEGGPAERAGLLRGDRIVSIDGAETGESPRLDWRTDDAYLPDPPMRFCLGELGDRIHLHVERRPGVYVDIDVECQPYSSFRAAKASAQVFEHAGRRIGYLHFWLIHMTGVDTLLRETLEGPFASCDAFVFDLRGRGGNGFMVPRILDILDGTASTWDKPVVALINGLSRSAKDVIAYEVRNRKIGPLVGETTAGAVVPATMENVGYDTYLMFPGFQLPHYSHTLEFVGVAPDIVVQEPGPYSAGRDPIRNAGLREATRLANEKALLASQLALETSGPWKKREDPVAEQGTEGFAAAAGTTCVKRTVSDGGESDVLGEDATAGLRPLTADLAVSTLLERMVDAIGGEEALRGNSARTLKGTLAIGGMFEGALTIHTAAPHYFRSTVSIEGFGTFSEGFDGKVGWGDGPQRGPRILEGRELAKMKVQADFYDLLNLEDQFASVKLSGLRQFAGKECYELELTDQSDNVRFMYVDPTTYLSAGGISTEDSTVGQVKVTSINEEYSEFQGVKVATRVKQDIGGMQEQTLSITDVSYGPLKKGTFDLPKSIRELLSRPAG